MTWIPAYAMAMVVGPHSAKNEIIRRWYMLSALLYFWGPNMLRYKTIDGPELDVFGEPNDVYMILRLVFRDMPEVRTYGAWVDNTNDWRALRWIRWTVHPGEFWIGSMHQNGPDFGSNENIEPPVITQEEFSLFIEQHQGLFSFDNWGGHGPYGTVFDDTTACLDSLETWPTRYRIELDDILPMGTNVPRTTPPPALVPRYADQSDDDHEYVRAERQWTKTYPPTYLRMTENIKQVYVAPEPLYMRDADGEVDEFFALNFARLERVMATDDPVAAARALDTAIRTRRTRSPDHQT